MALAAGPTEDEFYGIKTEVIPYSQNSQDRIFISNIKSAKQLKQLNEQQPDKYIISSCFF